VPALGIGFPKTMYLACLEHARRDTRKVLTRPTFFIIAVYYYLRTKRLVYPMAETVRRSGRDVTAVAVHNVARVEVLVDALIVGPGGGTEIGKLARILRRLNVLKSNDPVLKCAFTVMYPGQQYTVERAKMSIQRFIGFSGDLEQKATSFFKTLDSKTLDAMGRLFDTPASKKKNVSVDRLVAFLKSPGETYMDPLNVKKPKIVRRKVVEKVPENIAPLKSLGGYHHFCRLTSPSLELAFPQVVISLSLYFLVFFFTSRH
jgi:hypothetical protein